MVKRSAAPRALKEAAPKTPPLPVLSATNLAKIYRVADKQPGLKGTLRHFIKRKHREIHAVRGVDLAVEPGEVVGFLGPNGAGKTTAIKMLAGLIHPSAGEVRVLGHEPFKREHALLRRVTLVMGNKQQLIWDLPTLDTLRINAAMYGIPDREADRRTAAFAEVLGLGEELTQPVRKLSLGQRMKCELVAALLHHPAVLFLDEPTLGLDVNAQVAVRAFLKEYVAEHDAAALLTTHYMGDVVALCERVIVIDHGAVVHRGSLAGVVERFAPHRELKLAFERELTPEEAGAMRARGAVEEHEGLSARLSVERAALTGVVAELLRALPVADLTVSDPPIEETIAKLFDTPAEARL